MTKQRLDWGINIVAFTTGLAFGAISPPWSYIGLSVSIVICIVAKVMLNRMP